MDLARKKYSIEIGGKTLTVEFSRLAEQANAAALVSYEGTTVLVTAVMGNKDRTIGYMPLMVDYEEKFYAIGKILGSRYMRREGRSSEEATLSGRMIDRCIRPLFDHRLRRDIQVVATILSYDEEHDPDVVGLLGASAALATSNIPWNGPVGGIRVAKIGDRIVFNPKMSELASPECRFEAFVSGTGDRINMIELGGNEATEEEVILAFGAAGKEIQKLVEFQNKIIKERGEKKADVTLISPNSELVETVKKVLAGKLEEAVYTKEKVDRQSKIGILKRELKDYLLRAGVDEDGIAAADDLFEDEINLLIHRKIIETEHRPDGRKLDEVRELYAETGLLERTHGSALFIRGSTQALAVTTLGAPGAEQLIETMSFSGKRRFLLNYNFPPYSVGETGPFRGPGRREIGHGALAEKAIRRLIPSKEEFPYTIRVVSEILSSNGSSSMATVCATSMSLMHAGVPIKKHIAGIAMGLMTGEDGQFKVLTDIQGPEDHHGDMDFKAAGTRDGVTAIQMDVKIEGITLEMLTQGLAQAKKARLHIIEAMEGAIARPSPELSPYAPLILQLKIDPARIGAVIGSGGKVINGIVERTGVLSIDIEEDGGIFITAPRKESGLAAKAEIEAIVHEYKVGDIVEGKIIKILDFGAIVDLGGDQDGMIHVSELKEGFVKKVEDVVKLGDFVRAKIIRAEDGKIGLSIKQLSS
ncbi:MAG: polyribonucleotide nucleotidyltransferase [bacterium]|nr:polyribonucleotide nucleotidyltransferase [bacterium]